MRDVSLHLTRNDPLDVFPMTRAAVTSRNLLVEASDGGVGGREIAYVVKRPPVHGRLVVVVGGANQRGQQVMYYMVYQNLSMVNGKTRKCVQLSLKQIKIKIANIW